MKSQRLLGGAAAKALSLGSDELALKHSWASGFSKVANVQPRKKTTILQYVKLSEKMVSCKLGSRVGRSYVEDSEDSSVLGMACWC